jgi:hypothetical protein
MKDPSFQAEMKKYTSNPQFKEAMARASDDIEVISNLVFVLISDVFYFCYKALSRDPARMKKIEADMMH